MTADNLNYDQLRNLTIGSLDFVSPTEFKILLDFNAPRNTAINQGIPTLFPKVNGFVLIPNEIGAIVAVISWIRIEYSEYPKRKGMKDFDLIDLPFPLRKMSVNPLGILKNDPQKGHVFERGIYNYPSVGDVVILPTPEQLEAIVVSRDKHAKVNIGIAPIAANAPVNIDPDKLFGRHLAVLGNTGSGKSCSVAGLIRWSLGAAEKNLINPTVSDRPNARFIILDPNGEYSKTFDDLSGKVRKFAVKIDDISGIEQLRVPAWMWNSREWGSITYATSRTQLPLLRRALRELRGGSTACNTQTTSVLRRHFSSCIISLRNDLTIGVPAYQDFPGKQNMGDKLSAFAKDAEQFVVQSVQGPVKTKLEQIKSTIDGITSGKKNERGYYSPFQRAEIECVIQKIEDLLKEIGGLLLYEGPDEDSPIPFDAAALPDHLERLAREQNVLQFIDFLIMRIRTMLSDSRMASIIGTEDKVELHDWLGDYIGKDKSSNGEIAIIDLSLVPSDVTHLVIAVVARLIFEALQRYRRNQGKELPTVIVLEEAHAFIRRYKDDDESSPSRMCCQTFERIAREGRKFGLGLVLSSQRPSELSPTVLSQCNTFLLHRLVNDRDQELVKKLVPDNLGGLLDELPVLPTRKAILLGWAAPIPTFVEINELKDEERPSSADPKFWDVWTGTERRDIDWKIIAEDWTKIERPPDTPPPTSPPIPTPTQPSKGIF